MRSRTKLTAGVALVLGSALLSAWLASRSLARAAEWTTVFGFPVSVATLVLTSREPSGHEENPPVKEPLAEGRGPSPAADPAPADGGSGGDFPGLRKAGPDDRRPALVAGAVLALLASVAGFVSVALGDSPATSAGVLFSAEGPYTLQVLVAFAVLAMRGRQTFLLAFLLGTWWSSAAWLSWDAAAGSVGQLLTGTDRVVGGNIVGTASDALGLAAVIMLLAAWRPAWERGPAARARALTVLVLLSVAAVQVAEGVLFTAGYRTVPYHVDGAVLFLTGATAAWYATGLRGRRYGGALLLGWAARKGLSLAADLIARPHPGGSFTTSGVLACAAVAVTLALTVAYLRSRPAGLIGEHGPG
jgi:hypothetical protein